MQGDKNIIKFDGDHNSPRPQFYFDSITIFFHNVLAPPSSISDELYFHRMHDFIGPVSIVSLSWINKLLVFVCYINEPIHRLIWIEFMNIRTKMQPNQLKVSFINLMNHLNLNFFMKHIDGFIGFFDWCFSVHSIIFFDELELAPSSTEDAIAQLRSRRPMSRTEVSIVLKTLLWSSLWISVPYSFIECILLIYSVCNTEFLELQFYFLG